MPEDNSVLSEMERIVKYNMLKWHVGHEIFCKRCEAVMDCTRAVEVDVMRGEDLLKSMVVCAKCYDETHERLEEAARRLEGVRLEVNDGRKLKKGGQRCRI